MSVINRNRCVLNVHENLHKSNQLVGRILPIFFSHALWKYLTDIFFKCALWDMTVNFLCVCECRTKDQEIKKSFSRRSEEISTPHELHCDGQEPSVMIFLWIYFERGSFQDWFSDVREFSNTLLLSIIQQSICFDRFL